MPDFSFNFLKLATLTGAICLILAGRGYSQNHPAGEIININYSLQIAFADFSDTEPLAGDIVKVKSNNGAEVYLKVLEISPILSKLGIIPEGEYQTKLADFNQIISGNVITEIIALRAGTNNQAAGTERSELPQLTSDARLPDQENRDLEKKLQTLTEEYETQSAKLLELKNENKLLKQKISEIQINNEITAQERNKYTRHISELQKTAEQLKRNLKKMADLVQQEINAKE